MSDTEALEKICSRASEARARISSDLLTNDPAGLYDALKTARGATDTLEELLGRLILMRGRLQRMVQQLRGDVEDAEAALELEAKEYVSARERSLEITQRTLKERIQLRRADSLLTEASTAFEYVRTLHRGADATRRDIEIALRAVTLTTSLER